jgi:multiple sugar transport system substrate-binding protein
MSTASWFQRIVSRRFALAMTAQGLLGAVGLAACGGGTATVTGSAGSVASTSSAPASPSTTAAATSAAAATASSAGTATARSSSSAASAAAASSASSAAVSVNSTSGAAPAPSPAPTPTVNPNAIQLLGYGATQGYVEAVDLWNKQNPATPAQFTTGPYPAKFETLVAAGTPPDVVFIGTGGDTVLYAYKGVLRALDDYAKTSQVVVDDFFAGGWSHNLYQGKLYALVNELDPNFVLVYNASLLKQVGIDKPPATIQDLDDANAKLLKTQNGDVARIGIQPPWLTYSGQDTLATWLAVFGGSLLDPNNPKVSAATSPADVACLQWHKDYADRNGGYPALQKFVQGLSLNKVTPRIQSLLDGTTAMQPFVSSNTAIVLKQAKGTANEGSFQLAPMPAGPGVKPGPAWLGGWDFGLPNGTKRPDDAWKLMRWMNATPDGTDTWAEVNRFLPGYKKSGFYTKNANDAITKAYLQVLQTDHLVEATLGDFPGSAFTTLYDNILGGKVAVTTALAQFGTQLDAALAKIPAQPEGAF